MGCSQDGMFHHWFLQHWIFPRWAFHQRCCFVKRICIIAPQSMMAHVLRFFRESYVVGVIQECDCVDNLLFRVVLMCTFIDVFKLWSEDKPVRGQSFALPGGAFKQNPRPCSVSPHFEFCQSSVRGPLPHIPIIVVADMVAEERRCRGTAMSDTVGMPTRHHGQPNHQLSLAWTLPPPPYRGMRATQPQSTCVHARPPRAWEVPTREKKR